MTPLRFLDHIDPTVKFPTEITVGTDCSGIEAPIQALELLNIKPIHLFSSDNDLDVRKSIDSNYKPKCIYDDIVTRDHTKLPYVDLYIAGFPCQPFSTLGQRQGFNDQIRGTIFFECWKTIETIKPKIFILENVKGLINHDQGKTMATIMQCLKQLSEYNVYCDVYNTLDYGLPQNRERIYIIGLQKNHFDQFSKPCKIPLELNVTDLIDKNITKHFELTEHKVNILEQLLNLGKIDDLNNPWCVNLNVSSTNRTTPMKNICPCLLAGCVHYLTSFRRRFTPREYLRLQGFPDSFRQVVPDSKMYQQTGNSMSTCVLCYIYQAVFRCHKGTQVPLKRLILQS